MKSNMKPSLFRLLLLGSLLAFSLLSACSGDNGNESPDGDLDSGEEFIPPTDLVLNEIDVQGRDWLELANRSSEDTIDVAGWIVADDLEKSGHQYLIPGPAEIPPGGHLVVKQEEDDEAGFGFGVKSGDTAYLIDPTGTILDYVKIGELKDGESWGRYPDLTGSWQATYPTKEEPNRLQADSPASVFDTMAVYEIDLTVTDEAYQSLLTSPYEYTEADFAMTADGESSGSLSVGLRLKSGLSFRPIDQKASFKIRFDKYDDNLRFAGLKKLTLNNMVDDTSMLHEALSYYIFREVDIPASRTGYAWVRVNGEDYGLYAVIEPYDDIYTDSTFESMEHVYEGMVDLYLGQEENFEVDEGDDDDISDLALLISTINSGSDDDWAAAVGSVIDLDLALRLMAVEHYIGQADGYTLAANNYYLHSDKQGFFTMLPAGTDKTFVQEVSFGVSSSVLFARCLELPACQSRYEDQLELVVSGIQALGLDAWIDDLESSLESYVADDPKRGYTVEEVENEVDVVRSYLQDRQQAASSYLNR